MSRTYSEDLKQKALLLRNQGYTYTEIQDLTSYPVPKSTLTGWFRDISLSEESKKRIHEKMILRGEPGRAAAWKVNQRKRQELLSGVYNNANLEMKDVVVNNTLAKIILAILYLGEGGKTNEKISLGNSNPKIIELFLSLIRKSFDINETKFRGTVMCRENQDVRALEEYWSELSNIPLTQFYASRIDPRTKGKPTLKADYKGVFVVEYFSNKIVIVQELTKSRKSLNRQDGDTGSIFDGYQFEDSEKVRLEDLPSVCLKFE